MMLNAEQIKERDILRLKHSKGKYSQIGYDLSVKEIKTLRGTGQIYSDKTILPEYIPVNTTVLERRMMSKDDINHKVYGWNLSIGYYEVTFFEGCDIPSNLVGLIRQRSSMLRSGALLHSSVFDPGFKTENIGSFIAVFCPIFIEKDSRIAQIYFHECDRVAPEHLYGGKGSQSQFQFDNQRTS